jgi:hypothetical protein
MSDGPVENDYSALTFIYRNWRGDISERKIVSPSLWWGETSFHQKPQWFLRGCDVHKGEMRDFAIADILTPPRAS